MDLDRSSLAEFFRNGIREVKIRKNLHLTEETEFYVVNLLSEFLDAERLFGSDNSPTEDKPLALIYAQAIDTENERERFALFRLIGDRSLYVSGFFPDSFRRKIIDVDYYMAMGEQAYASVSSLSKDRRQGDLFADLFQELAEKFVALVDAISEVSEASGVTSNSDILRLYERWMHTKSRRLFELLQAKGIQPTKCKKGPLH